MRNPTRIFLTFAALGVALIGTAAQADCISISNLPYTITQSGSYCVTADLTTSLTTHGTAISIVASNVDLDLQGHSIKNISTPTAYDAYGVQFTGGELTNVTVHNGILSGFFVGLGGHVDTQVSNLTIDQVSVTSSTFLGIGVSGPNVRITNNRITSTIGTYQATGISVTGTTGVLGYKASNRAVIQGNYINNTYAASTTQAYARGIAANNYADLLIRDNTVNNTRAPAIADSSIVGIDISQTLGLCDGFAPCNALVSGLIVQDNTIGNALLFVRNLTTNSFGIQIAFPGDHAIVTGSKISNLNTGIDSATRDNAWPNTPPVLLLNNTITGANSPIRGGVTLPQ